MNNETRFYPASQSPAAAVCSACGHANARLKWQTFNNGTRHVRADCAACGTFLRFAPQSIHARTLADAGGVLAITEMLTLRREVEGPA